MLDPCETSPPPTCRFCGLAPWILWICGMLVAFYPALLSGFRNLQLGYGDPRLVNYILEHSWLWVTGHPLNDSFWSPPVFYPAANVGAYSDTMVGSGPIYWLFRGLGAGPGYALQLWMMSCLSLCFLFTYIFLRRCLSLER